MAAPISAGGTRCGCGWTMKRLQLERLHGQSARSAMRRGAGRAGRRGARGGRAADRRRPRKPDPQAVERLWAARHARPARRGADRHRAAAASCSPPPSPRRRTMRRGWRWLVARGGLAAHGLALAHTHVRLNAAQVHNAVRQRLGLAASADDMAQRRGSAGRRSTPRSARSRPRPVDFGALIAEQASAAQADADLARRSPSMWTARRRSAS